ncbi:uncharacterized protein [Epargyreus clarus]|uniref:uncharacterized protein n=1 Tax=Epargyreus clarus TaxID=520877 RepID=UPI003C2FB668
MRRILLSIIALYAVTEPVSCSDVGKDGFNFYKDYLRGRNDDIIGDEMYPSDRMVYFYRTPLQLYPGLTPVFEQEYKKRNENIFKNHMMNKEALYLEIPRKRTSKTALSLMMQNKNTIPK